MGKIALLPEQLINQIAAGEVVERPASVVKELLENSVDAGAGKIVVTVRQGGIGLIRISDDGCGMSEEDALMSLERHATSKIRQLEDLNSIRSMGFRGEAMASIASVSRMTLRSKRAEDNSGIELLLEGGKLLKKAPVGMSEGTEIEVADLFFNTPARLKFLKSENTEYQNILDTVINAAMAFPQISFKFIQETTIENTGEEMNLSVPGQKTAAESRVVLDLPSTEDLLVRIRGVLGKSISDDLIEIYNGAVNLGIRGFIGKPQLSRANRSMQYLFVNGRPISSPVLSYAVKQAYHSLLPKERYPAFIIMFELDPSMVDVNCHPRKTEVKFRDEREVFRVLTQSCNRALEKAVLMPKIGADNFNYYQERQAGTLADGLAGPMGAAAVTVSGPEVATLQFQSLGSMEASRRMETVQVGPDSSRQNTTPIPPRPVPPLFAETDRQELRPLGQLNNSFILCQRGGDLVIIDQHAAHERIRYNKLMSESSNEEKTVQPLLVPVNLELPPADIAVLNANKAVLEEIGLKLEHFGGNTFAINEVPAYLVKANLAKVLPGLIDDLRAAGENGNGCTDSLADWKGHKGDLFGRKEKILTYLACRSAVKFGDPLSAEEIQALIDQLNQTTFGSATCPHGRPIMVVLEESELWSRFGRKYSGFFENEKFRDVNC
jgi:DNA mismatch repair protein MutL